MPKIPVENLKPGMKLARAVENDSGMVLMGAGTELTYSTIERLSTMNISGVFIEGSTEPTKTKEEMLSELDARFKKTENEPHMADLKRVMQEHIDTLYKK